MMMVLYEPADPVSGFETVSHATYSMFLLMIGLGVNDSFNSIQKNQMANLTFVLFICLTVILLLNMLIAAMNESYSGLAQLRNEIWTRNRSSVMIRFEGGSFIVWLMIKLGKYLQHDPVANQYILIVESSDPPNCV